MIDVLVATIAGMGAPLVRSAIQAWLERRAQRQLQEAKLERILESPNLHVLGEYLDNDLGDIDVGRYATDHKARKKVDLVLGRLRGFLGPLDSHIESRRPQSPAAETPSPPLSTASATDRSFQKSSADPGSASRTGGVATHETSSKGRISATQPPAQLPDDIRKRLDSGDEWAALVLLRSRLERQSREYLRSLGEDVPDPAPLGRLIGRLRDRGLIEPRLAAAVTRATTVMNRAAHGEEIPADDILATLDAAARMISALTQSSSDDQKTIAEAYGVNVHDLKSPGAL